MGCISNQNRDIQGKSTSVHVLLLLNTINQTFDTLQMGFSKSLAPYYSDVLSLALSHLQTLLPTFTHYYLTSENEPPTAAEEDPIDLSMIGCPTIDLIAAITRSSKAKSWLQPSTVETLVLTLCGWIQMTEDDVKFI